MPEYTELQACFHTIQRWYNEVRTPSNPLRLLAIWSDATKAEQARAKKSSRAGQGLVYRLEPSSKVRRGPKSAQKSIWPQLNGKPLANLDGMFLQGVNVTPRTIILDLNRISFQIQLLTHSLAQPYTRDQWDEEVAQVSCAQNARGFRVGIAFDFGNYVLAFLSADNLWTPHWFDSSTQAPPVQHIDVHADYITFLDAIAKCVQTAHARGFHRCTKLAVAEIREEYGHIFGGVGTYTVVELFFSAGLSVFLTTGEVFAYPSRLARLCEAFWAFAHRAHADLQSLIKPAYVGYILAPTEQHRLSFSFWLHVHGKQQAYMPERMKCLQRNYEDTILQPPIFTMFLSRRSLKTP
ncbi:hypothetical protein C8Q79DRAFT_465257 [Trametes meyenii]|nr:hypothetical protein C8Q79DRAFT_465257 [Trametes meyenii]